MKKRFIKALETNDLTEMRKIPKSDLQNIKPLLIGTLGYENE